MLPFPPPNYIRRDMPTAEEQARINREDTNRRAKAAADATGTSRSRIGAHTDRNKNR